jgi:hypothetical protein
MSVIGHVPTLADGSELPVTNFEEAKSAFLRAFERGHVEMVPSESWKSSRHRLNLGPDAPTETNERGASQSKTEYLLTAIDPSTLLAVGAVMAQGERKYGPDNWRRIDVGDHINHALVHLVAWLAGDRQDDHLTHAICRAIFAHAVENQPEGSA